MPVKTMRRQSTEPEFTQMVSNLFSISQRNPKIVTTKFSRALGLRVEELVAQNVSALLSRERPTTSAKQAWTTTLPAGGGIDEAFRQGKRFRHETLASKEMLSSSDGARLAGITRQALDDRRKKNQALALNGSKRGFRYPRWQFEDHVAASLPNVLQVLARRDPWEIYLFFVEPEPLLGGETPLQALRTEKGDDVLRIAGLLFAQD